MREKSPFKRGNDKATVAAFLELLSKDLNASYLSVERSADVASFADSRDLSSVDVNLVVTCPVDI